MWLLLSLFHRATTWHTFETSHAAFGSFGFLPNATASYRFQLTDGSSAKIRFLIASESDYLSFISTDDLESRARQCAGGAFTPLTDLNLTILQANGTYNYSTVIRKKSVLVPFALHCGGELPFIEYELTLIYDNIDTKLDYREIPNLITLPVLAGLLGLLIFVWVAASLWMHRQFQLLQLVIAALLFLYLLTLILTYAWYKHADISDDGNGWQICCIVFDALYWSLLLVFLLIAASGWGTMQTSLTVKKIVITFVSSFVAVGLLTVLRYVDLGFWVLALFLCVGVAGYFMLEELLSNADAAKSHVKAHLFVIRRDGLDPKTTPVFDKFTTYSAFTYFVTISFAIIVILVLLLLLVDAANWIVTLFYYGYHLCLLGGLGWLYRPRGEVFDKYFRVDDQELGDRDEIDLDDLTGFDVNANEGTRPWDGSSALPREPVVRGRPEGPWKPDIQQPFAGGSGYT
jgi:hypothetical protein